MKKSYRYTILSVCLALAVSFGSMAGMDAILKARKQQLLAEHGEAGGDTQLQGWEGQASGKDAPGKEGGSLTTEQAAEAIRVWYSRLAVDVHSPVEGQVSMEEAIKAGEEWMVGMGIEGYVQKKGGKGHTVFATLGAPIQSGAKEPLTKPYYSFWRVQFFSTSMQVFLYINAVTGKVLEADINTYGIDIEEVFYGKLRRFVELSGLLPDGAQLVSIYEETEYRREAADLEIDGVSIFAALYLFQDSMYSMNENGSVSFSLVVG